MLAKPFERAVLLERVRGLLPARPVTREARDGREASPVGLRTVAETREMARVLVEPVTTLRMEPPTGQRYEARPEVRYEARPEVRHEPRPEPRHEPVIHHVGPSDAELEAAIARVLDQRLSQLVSQRLPALLDGALTRLLPQAVLETTQRVVAERVPGAVDNAVRATLSEVATPARIERAVAETAKAAVERAIAGLSATVQPELAGAVDSVKARVEGELLGRLDQFARNELPARLVAHAEQIVWKVVPTIAEDLVKEELKRLTAE